LPLAAKKLAATGKYMRYRHRLRAARRDYTLRLRLLGDSARVAAGADGCGCRFFCVLTCDTLEQAMTARD